MAVAAGVRGDPPPRSPSRAWPFGEKDFQRKDEIDDDVSAQQLRRLLGQRIDFDCVCPDPGRRSSKQLRLVYYIDNSA